MKAEIAPLIIAVVYGSHRHCAAFCFDPRAINPFAILKDHHRRQGSDLEACAIKRATGSGRAGKDQVASMVTRILELDERPTPADAADALALAICHLWRTPMQQRLLRAGGGAR